MVENNYLKEKDSGFTPLLAIEEASRCLLCHDAPCASACPAMTDPAKFIRSLRFRNFKGAVETIRENNILGGICARVCPTSKYCEEACSRSGIDKPIQIAKLQRYLTDYEKSIEMKVLKPVELTKEKVAIIGSGPSGLTAAAELALKGYNVTVFEKNAMLGGWLSYGIPAERLPQSVVEDEINYIKDLGVTFKANCEIGKDISISDLKKDGFESILVAVGMQDSKLVDIPGIHLDGVVKGTDFLANAKSNNGNIPVGKKVIVIGGGDVAMDCAVTCKLIGCEDVKIVYRRTLEKMPADIEEIKHVQALNIPIFTGLKPESITGENGKASRIQAVGMFDDSKIDLPADTVIFAIGQKSENIKKIADIDLVNESLVETKNYKTSIDGIFASGDIVDGDKTVVYAVKHGKEVANEIDVYLTEKRENSASLEIASAKGDK